MSTISDYQAVGGGPAIKGVVNDFYRRVLADPALAPYFAGVDMAELKRHQSLLVAQVMGGPTEYDGRQLAQAHAGLHVTGADFDRVVAHLVASLQAAGVPQDIIGRVGVALAAAEADIVEDRR